MSDRKGAARRRHHINPINVTADQGFIFGWAPHFVINSGLSAEAKAIVLGLTCREHETDERGRPLPVPTSDDYQYWTQRSRHIANDAIKELESVGLLEMEERPGQPSIPHLKFNMKTRAATKDAQYRKEAQAKRADQVTRTKAQVEEDRRRQDQEQARAEKEAAKFRAAPLEIILAWFKDHPAWPKPVRIQMIETMYAGNPHLKDALGRIRKGETA